MRKTAQLMCLFMALSGTFVSTGCCSRKSDKADKPRKESKQEVIRKGDAATSLSENETNTRKDIPTLSPAVSDAEKLSASLYRRLDYSFEMFRRDNMDGALRELERLQLEINNDPYLEMQSWYLSAMIYHKTGKASRRKRSMRKMLETMEQLQEDPRFKRSFQDGMDSQDLINMALKKSEGKYADYE